MKNLISFSFLFICIIIVVVSLMFTSDYSYYGINEEEIFTSQNGFTWPIPCLSKISSYFGIRISPTLHASSFHYGLDIPANENTYFLASISGYIVYTGFNGSGGFTIILENDNIRIIYCHVSPYFVVSVGDYIEQGQVIGQVGPYHVYNVPNNPYKDSQGIPTNRCYYWVSFTFCNKNKRDLSRPVIINSYK